jgi:hypothetical protein
MENDKNILNLVLTNESNRDLGLVWVVMYYGRILSNNVDDFCKATPRYLVDNTSSNKLNLWQIISNSQQQTSKTLKALLSLAFWASNIIKIILQNVLV